jgi:hypothetical protein
VESQIDAEFELKIRNRGLIPCWDDFEIAEEHIDEIIEVVMLKGLPPAHPVEHAFDRESTLSYRQRRERKAWQERHEALERSMIRFFQQSTGVHRNSFWTTLAQEMDANLARWKTIEVPELKPEEINVQEEESKAWKWIFAFSYPTVGKEWDESSFLQNCIGRCDFFDKVLYTMKNILPSRLQIKGILEERASFWTEQREKILTNIIQAADHAKTIAQSEMIRKRLLYCKAFHNLDPQVIKQQEMRIRALCADEEVITNAAKRCWEEYFVEMDDDVATDNVCQHLSHYGKLKTVIIDKLVAGALTNLLLDNVDDDYRKHMGSQLLLILGHLELGYS